MPAKCRIVCDSTCDLTAQQAKDLDVTIIYMHYSEPGKSDGGLSGTDDLFQSISPHEFYDAMRRGACPSTSQISVFEYKEIYQRLYDDGIPSVMFTLSSGLSGTYDSAVLALEEFKAEHADEEVRIYVCDSMLAAAPFGLLTIEACRKRDEGLNAEQIVQWAADAPYLMHTAFMVDNLDALHRGGRIPKGVAVVGDALDVKPILHFNLDGSLGICGVARGRKKGLRWLIDNYKKKRLTDGSHLAMIATVADSDVPEDGYALAGELRAIEPELEVLRPSIGPTIGCHVGPGMCAVCFWGADRRTQKQVTKVKGVRQEKPAKK